jgi:GNAT superfamily N-acetyltransferase
VASREENRCVGVYVDEARRCQGYGTKLVSGLLEKCGELAPARRIYADADWWPKYVDLIAAAGCKHLEWD